MASIISKTVGRLYNAFQNSRSPTSVNASYETASVSTYKPDTHRVSPVNKQTIVGAIINRIALDFADTEFHHAEIDKRGTYKREMNTSLNLCLTLGANLDQDSTSFLQDFVVSCCDEGVVAGIPVITKGDPYKLEAFDTVSLRTGQILEWYPDSIRCRAYDERKGQYDELIVKKATTVIVENPFKMVMNENGSLAKRLTRKMALLDALDEEVGSHKVNLIIQLPYSLKSQTRQAYAEKRRQEIEDQLHKNQFGIAYIDSTEKIIQLNRSLENNLLEQVDVLTKQLYSQFCITEEVLNGSADPQTMTNYWNRTVKPYVVRFCKECSRKLISTTAYTQGKRVLYFKDPFSLATLDSITSAADTFSRNAIMSSNEIRGKIGMIPSDDPNADKLINNNINHSDDELNGTDPNSQTSLLPESAEDTGESGASNSLGSMDDDVVNQIINYMNNM